ncbi:ATPase, AAA-type, core [Niveomyces insectorum RCEF 264]|uniref:ATPase, AAA-type, core n=1 Tax=Niveomyces insectorum RCEF 264 TaxID=1081102 RepID=A0A167PRK1_9HYPO|nr:ATPase, AAA-type, core [Niveomyces insectorum RCEF 264]
MLAAASRHAAAAAAAFLGNSSSSSSPSPTSSAAGAKRTHLHEAEDPAVTGGSHAVSARKPRPALGGFLDDDDSDKSDDEATEAGPMRTADAAGDEETVERPLSSPPPAKRRMLARLSDDGNGRHTERARRPEKSQAAMRDGENNNNNVGAAPGHGPFVDDDDDDDDDDDVDIPDAQIRFEASQPPQVMDVDHAAEKDNDDGAPDVVAVPVADEEDRYDILFGGMRKSMLMEAETRPLRIQTCAGRSVPVRTRVARAAVPYETLVAARSRTKAGRAQRSFYGIAIHELVDGAQRALAEKQKRQAEQQAQQEQAERKAKEAEESQRVVEAEVDAQKDVATDDPRRPAETNTKAKKKKDRAGMLWTEKYRARTFLDLVGDDYTNRLVLRWLKRWDPVVFPLAAKARRRDAALRQRQQQLRQQRPDGPPGGDKNNNFASTAEEAPQRPILLLAGPPGLGKTTLAHVCARQAGYEVLEINASDDRSRDVVQGRIRTSLGTESVKMVETKTAKNAARPVCVVVDEVDGAVGGSSATGEGGFVKALLDLVRLDQKNRAYGGSGGAAGGDSGATTNSTRRKKGDAFRQMRPLILICNDVYHTALRPLRQSGLAEIVHVGTPSVDAVVNRLTAIFAKEGIRCEKEAARKLCEAAWGRGAGGSGEEFRASSAGPAAIASPQLTRFWVDTHILPDLVGENGNGSTGGAGGGGGLGARGLGRGGVRDILARIFQEGAGFPHPSAVSAPSARPVPAGGSATAAGVGDHPHEQMSFAEHRQRHALARLRELVETSGDVDRIVADVFAEYPLRDFNDDSYLSKPDAAYEWLHFHDACTHRLFGSNQQWELAPYASQPVLACQRRRGGTGFGFGFGGGDGTTEDTPPPHPFSGPRADYAAREATKHNRAALQALQANLPASLLRAFRSPEDVAADLLPYVPNGGSRDSGEAGRVWVTFHEGLNNAVRKPISVEGFLQGL